MSENPKLATPIVKVGDHLHAAGRAGLGAIPFAGAAAVEIFNAVITPPIEKRRREWMVAIGAIIEQLQAADAGIVETLQNNKQFQSVLLQATWAAVRNHQQEKLTALHNAVLHAAQGTRVSEDLQLLFVRFVDELTPTHLVVIDFLAKQEQVIAQLESYQNLVDAFCGIAKQSIDPIFFKLVCDDLKARSLVRISNEFRDLPGLYEETRLAINTGPATKQLSENPKIIVTHLGRAFINFVLTNPLRGAK